MIDPWSRYRRLCLFMNGSWPGSDLRALAQPMTMCSSQNNAIVIRHWRVTDGSFNMFKVSQVLAPMPATVNAERSTAFATPLLLLGSCMADASICYNGGDRLVILKESKQSP
jgi:hypothetical protein